MTDRTTKVLLFAIALGLWMHVVGDWLRPTAAQAQAEALIERMKTTEIAKAVQDISADTSAMRITLKQLAAR